MVLAFCIIKSQALGELCVCWALGWHCKVCGQEEFVIGTEILTQQTPEPPRLKEKAVTWLVMGTAELSQDVQASDCL